MTLKPTNDPKPNPDAIIETIAPFAFEAMFKSPSPDPQRDKLFEVAIQDGLQAIEVPYERSLAKDLIDSFRNMPFAIQVNISQLLNLLEADQLSTEVADNQKAYADDKAHGASALALNVGVSHDAIDRFKSDAEVARESYEVQTRRHLDEHMPPVLETWHLMSVPSRLVVANVVGEIVKIQIQLLTADLNSKIEPQ